MIRSFLLVLIAAVVAPGVAGAQAPLTLQDAVSRTLSHNAAVRETRAGEDEASARIAQARAGYLPRVDFVEGWQRSDQPVFVFSTLLMQRRFTAADFALEALNNPDAISNHRAALVVEQPLYDGHRTRTAVSDARRAEEMARLESARTAADLTLAATRAYGRVLAAVALHASTRSAVESALEDLRRAEARRDVGLETEANVLALRVHHSNVEAGRIRAASDETIARATLNALMGTSLDEVWHPSEPVPPGDGPLDAAALEAAALTGRPELRQAALRQDRAAAARTRARAAFLPQVVAQGAAEANGDGFGDRATAWSAGVQLRWNIFAGGADAARLKESAGAIVRAQAERERLETDVRLEVRAAIAEHQSARAREQTSRLTVDQARESQRIIRDRYEAGLAPASDLLRAGNLVLQAEAARIASAVDVHVTAAAIERAVGTAGNKS